MHTFKKEERLKSKKIIGRLFNREGSSFAIFPLRIVWLKTELNSNSPAQFTVSVPKRNFKRAVHRNRIRRQLKEAYRLNKHILYNFLEEKEMQCAFMVLYTGRKALPYEVLEQKMQQAIKRFIKINSRKKNKRKTV